MSAIADARRIHSSKPVVDGHNDLPWALREAGHADLNGIDLLTHQAELHTDLPRLTDGGFGVPVLVGMVPASDPTPLRTTLEQIDLVHRMAARYPGHMKVVGTAQRPCPLRIRDWWQVSSAPRAAMRSRARSRHCGRSTASAFGI